MRKILIMVAMVIISLSVYAATPVEGDNILKNYPFFKTGEFDPNYQICQYSFNNKWHGFHDYYNSESVFGFQRSIDFEYGVPMAPNPKAFFKMDKEHATGDKYVYITNLPNIENCINVDLDNSFIYNIGFYFAANDLSYDQRLKSCFVAGIEWFDEEYNLIKKDIRCENITRPQGQEFVPLGADYLKYSVKVIPPTNAKYFKYIIFAGKGLFIENNQKAVINSPFMIPEALPVLDVNIVNETEHSIYNQRYIKTPMADVPDLQSPITCVSTVNFNSSKYPAEYLGYKTTGLLEHFSVKVYNVQTPNTVLNIATDKTYEDSYDKIGVIKFKIPWSNLETGKYIVETKIADGSKVLGTAKTYFYVEGDNKFSQPYGPKDNLLKINGVSEFLVGIVDRGVGYDFKDLDANGWPKLFEGINKTTRDILGANEDVVPLNYDEKFLDYLHPIQFDYEGYDGYSVFSYSDFKKLGLNFVYPAYFAHLPYLDVNKQLYSIQSLKNIGINVFYPMHEYQNYKLTEDIQRNLHRESGLFGNNTYGSQIAFEAVGKIANASDNILGYVIDENVNTLDMENTVYSKEKMESLDLSHPCAVTVDISELLNFDGLNQLIKNANINKACDLIIVNLKPMGSYWTNDELQNLQNGYYLSIIEKLDKPVIVNLSLENKKISDEVVPLSIRDMKTIYSKFASSKKVAGIIYDNASQMVNTETPVFDYNKFKVFLYEVKNNLNDFENRPYETLPEEIGNNPLKYLDITYSNVTNLLNEINVEISDLNGDGVDDFVYTGYVSSKNLPANVAFQMSQTLFDLFTLNVEITSKPDLSNVNRTENVVTAVDTPSDSFSVDQINIIKLEFISK